MLCFLLSSPIAFILFYVISCFIYCCMSQLSDLCLVRRLPVTPVTYARSTGTLYVYCLFAYASVFSQRWRCLSIGALRQGPPFQK